MYKPFLLFLFTLMTCCSLFAQSDAEKALQKGKAQYEKGSYQNCIKSLNASLSLDSSLAKAFAYRAACKLAEMDEAGAMKDANISIRKDSTISLAWLTRAQLKRNLFEYDPALQDHIRAIELKPNSGDMHYEYGLTLNVAGQTEGAKTAFSKAIELDPTLYRAWREKGALEAQAGDTAQARIDLDKAIELARKDPVNYNSRGLFLKAANGNHTGALEDYKMAIKLNPNYAYAFNNRGWSHYKTGEVDKALKDIKMSLNKRGDNPWAYRNLAVMSQELERKDEACSNAQMAIRYHFTEMYGSEMEDLMKANCKKELIEEVEKAKESATPAKQPTKTQDPTRTRRSNAP